MAGRPIYDLAATARLNLRLTPQRRALILRQQIAGDDVRQPFPR